MLWDMKNYVYNSTFAPKAPDPPLPREFSFIYLNGWGCRGVAGGGVEDDLSGIKSGDVLIANIGAHCSRTQPYGEWSVYMKAASCACVEQGGRRGRRRKRGLGRCGEE
jgi:hypothetical protein